jgi:hypothetical protein
VLALVLCGLDGREEVAISADHYRRVVKVHERKCDEIRRHKHVDALFDHRFAVAFGNAHADFQVRRVEHRLQELALLRGDVGVAFGILTDVVVVGPDQLAVSGNLLGKLAEVQIVSSADFAQDVIKIASVDEHHDSLRAVRHGRRSRCRH